MSMSATVLIVDDEASLLDSLRHIMLREGFEVLACGDAREALDLLRKQRVDVLLTDLMMPGPGGDGRDLLKAARALSPETECIVMTAYGTVENAVEAMKEGAYDFVSKPVKRATIVRAVRKALEKRHLVAENRALRAQLEAVSRRPIVGQSLTMRRTLEISKQAARSDATVLLLGESGTGKELLARAIHENSMRAAGPFVPVNCAAIPESILEAELFGYERGAFTGAVQAREGRFQAAAGGTLFLDEIGEVAPSVQVKLLRVLQEGEIERLGAGGKPVRVDLRLVAATNKDLARAVREGRFREDLYYRLNVISVTIPPLRDRRDDVPLLAEHFLEVYRTKNAKPVQGFTKPALARLCGHDWPGNVRELENAVERAVVLTRNDVIDVEDLPDEVRGAPPAGADGRSMTFPIGTALDEIERRVIRETLAYAKGDKRLCAQLLGIATRTIYRKLDDEPAE
jgi:two-component system, NtrC family, response regulator HydG